MEGSTEKQSKSKPLAMSIKEIWTVIFYPEWNLRLICRGRDELHRLGILGC